VSAECCDALALGFGSWTMGDSIWHRLQHDPAATALTVF
jgi:hypothetical protein